MATSLSDEYEGTKLVVKLSTEIELFFVLGSLLLLLDAYLYRASSRHYSLLTFDWSSQHGFNIGAIVGFLVAFSFVMTVVTPLLLVIVQLMMQLPWWSTLMFEVFAVWLGVKVGIPFLWPIFIVLATAPTWREIASCFEDEEKRRARWRAPDGHVSTEQLKEFAYKNEKVYLLDRLDKYYAGKSAGESKRLERVAAGFMVAIVINAAVDHSGRETMVWQLLTWSSAFSDELQRLIQIAAGIFFLVVLSLVARFFRSDFHPDWIYYPPLAEELKEQERRRQEERSRPFRD